MGISYFLYRLIRPVCLLNHPLTAGIFEKQEFIESAAMFMLTESLVSQHQFYNNNYKQ